jgi:carbonic anhydrase/acetyltransferase-like protein (isoleucine patch superfamily)
MSVRSFAGKTPSIAPTALVDDTAVVIGDVTVGENSSVWPLAVLRGDVGPVVVGRDTNIQDGCILHGTPAGPTSAHGQFVTVGDRVTVGHGAVLHGCKVGNDCLIGLRAVIMDGAIVPDGTVIGATGVVPAGMQLEPGFVWAGNPVCKLRALTEQGHALLRESARHYVLLSARYGLASDQHDQPPSPAPACATAAR